MTEQKPTHKMQYPQSCRMLLVRDCTVAICNGNNSPAIFLSTALFWHDHPRPGDHYNDEKSTFTFCRTQSQIEEQACNQIDAKTIHNVAVPYLQLFGFLDLQERMNGNLYTFHMDRINAAYAAYEKGPDALKSFLISSLQLENFLISVPSDQLENFLINKKFLQLQLETILIQNRKFSNCKRGRKRKPQEPSDGNFPDTESNREFIENNTEREECNGPPTSPNSDASLTHSSSSLHSLNKGDIEKQLADYLKIIRIESIDTLRSRLRAVGSTLKSRTGQVLIDELMRLERAKLEGGVTNPPSSVKGVSFSSATGGGHSSAGGVISSNPGGDDTLNLETSANVKPQIFAQNAGYQPAKTISSTRDNDVTIIDVSESHAEQASDVTQSSTDNPNSSHIAIHTHEGTSPTQGEDIAPAAQSAEVTLDVQRDAEVVKSGDGTVEDYTKGSSVFNEGLVDTNGITEDAMQQGQSESPQSCVTSMDEVKIITQEMIVEWVNGVKDEGGKSLIKWASGPMKRQEQIDKLLSFVKCEKTIRELYDIARAQFKDGRPIYLGNLANDDVIEKWEETQPQECPEMPVELSIEDLERAIWEKYPTLFTQPINDENWGKAVLIWYGPTGNDYLFVRHWGDWTYWICQEPDKIQLALAYADFLASQQLEGVAI